MQTPEWLKPGLYGAVCGAVAVAIAGFTWGGWVTAARRAPWRPTRRRLRSSRRCR